MSHHRIHALTATVTHLIGPGIVAFLLTLIGWGVAVALADGLIGIGAALVAFVVATPVLRPILGAGNERARS